MKFILHDFPKQAMKDKSQMMGYLPLWIGNEMFYTNYDNELMVVKTEIEGSDIDIGLPVRLFDGEQIGRLYRKYAVKLDGREILAVCAHSQQLLTMCLLKTGIKNTGGRIINPDEKHVHPEHYRA